MSEFAQEKLDFNIERSAISRPDISISQAAHSTLIGWGFSEADVSTLLDFTSAYEYRQCAYKVSQISEVYATAGNTVVQIPNFFSLEDRNYGQCADLAEQLLISLSRKNFLNAASKSDLAFVENLGHIPQFFCRDSQSHVWISIIPYKSGTLPNILPDGVVLDPSFRLIALASEAGYKPRQGTIDPRVVDRNHTAKVNVVPLSLDIYQGMRLRLEHAKDAAILGITQDWEYAVGLGFFSVGDNIYPYLQLINRDGFDFAYFCFSPLTGEFGSFNTDKPIDINLNPAQRSELISILHEAEKIKIIESDAASANVLRRKSLISLR